MQSCASGFWTPDLTGSFSLRRGVGCTWSTVRSFGRARVEMVRRGADYAATVRITHPVCFQSGPLDPADLFKTFKELLARA